MAISHWVTVSRRGFRFIPVKDDAGPAGWYGDDEEDEDDEEDYLNLPHSMTRKMMTGKMRMICPSSYRP